MGDVCFSLDKGMVFVELYLPLFFVNFDKDVLRACPVEPFGEEWTGFDKKLLPIGLVDALFLGLT